MSKMIFINLPVTDLERSKRFYGAIGARNEPKFTDDNAAMMVFSDAIYVMLLKHDFYSTFTSKPIADAQGSSQMILALSVDMPADVDALVEKAGSAGGTKDPSPRQDLGGMMYERSFEDPDGHHWEAVWMDPKAAEQGASAFQEA